MNVSNFGDAFKNSSKSLLFGPGTTQFRWDLKRTLSLQLTIGATAVACPWIIFLNILVILAIKKVRELQKNSNILITNLAVTDLLVGAVSMPLSITVDALILQGTVSHSTIYLLSEIGVSVLITLYTISYRHLLLIAWERYVAIVKWTEYKALVTKGRMKKYTLIVWMESVTYMALHQALVLGKIPPEVLLVVDLAINLSYLTETLPLLYFYGMIYIVLRRQNRCQISQLSALIKAKRERKLAFTAFLLLIAAFICSVPILVLMTSASYSPVFRTYSALRWVYIVVQINSLANPFLYFYRNKRYRKALLQIIGFEKTQEIERIDPKGHCARRNRCTVEPMDTEGALGFKRSHSLPEQTLGQRNTRVSKATTMERRMSAPCLTKTDSLQSGTQPF
ncbi:5-hydroxytryptamine receptor 1D-like [Pocillopora verrucosa]|uniref:5-hydroxytryptamine receptor 1D-like n=1 Tax=Pocillopora verrucosa TaxID=203993 RepID=UPI0033413FAD